MRLICYKRRKKGGPAARPGPVRTGERLAPVFSILRSGCATEDERSSLSKQSGLLRLWRACPPLEDLSASGGLVCLRHGLPASGTDPA